MPANRRVALSLLAVALLGVAVSACGHTSTTTSTSTSGPTKVAEGEPVTLDGLQFTITARYLNPHNNQDAAYIAGEPAPSEGLRYAGVYVEVQNEGAEPRPFPTMLVRDAVGTEHAAFPATTPYARHFGEVVKPHETQPALDSTGQGPAKPSLLLFRLSPATDKPPLTLHIQSFKEGSEATVTLDL
jgi:hypothetical protein